MTPNSPIGAVCRMSKGAKKNNTSDSLTLLVCSPGYSASKKIHRDDSGSIAIKGFNAGKYFGVIERPVRDIEDLSKNLTALEAMPNTLVIRGALVSGHAPVGVQRTKANFVTPATGKRWVMLDIDKLPCPPGVNLKTDLEAAMDFLVHELPEEFHDVTYHYQLSSSSGFSEADTISAHLWFWLTVPCTDADLKQWAKNINQDRKNVDPALFNDVQAHYTAAPIFEDVENPFPTRSGLVSKNHQAVHLQIPKVKKLTQSARSNGTDVTESVGFEGYLSKIGDQPGGDGFHNAIISAIASHVSAVGRKSVDRDQLYKVIRDRVIAADRSKHDDTYVEKMASREHIMPAIEGAMDKFGDQPTSRSRSRLIKDVAPPPTMDVLTSTEGHKALSSLLDTSMGGVKP